MFLNDIFFKIENSLKYDYDENIEIFLIHECLKDIQYII